MMTDTREKLIELLDDIQRCGDDFDDYEIYGMRLPNTVSNDDVADHLIANGVTIQKWIPVTERLPSQYSSVIVWTRDREIGEAQHDGKLFYWCEDDNFADVTHWMPLPAPPTEVSP